MVRAGGGARNVLYGRVPEDALSQTAGALYFAMDAGEDSGRHQPLGGQQRCLRCCRRSRYSGAPWSRLLTCSGGPNAPNGCAADGRTAGGHFLFPSRLSKCPRSCVHRALLAQSRRWNSWWKRLRSCLLSMSSGSLSSSPLTFQFALGVVLVDVFKIFFLDSIPPRLWSRSPTFQFLIMVSLEVFKVFTHRFLKKLLGKRFKGFLAFFPGGKKREGRSALGVGTECGLWFIHAAGSFRPVLGG